jgi:hypothetical protein
MSRRPARKPVFARVDSPEARQLGDDLDELRDRLTLAQSLLNADVRSELLEWPTINATMERARAEVLALGKLLGDPRPLDDDSPRPGTRGRCTERIMHTVGVNETGTKRDA